jgi:hypothetical protein
LAVGGDGDCLLLVFVLLFSALGEVLVEELTVAAEILIDGILAEEADRLVGEVGLEAVSEAREEVSDRGGE